MPGSGAVRQPWLRLLVRFLARYTWAGQEYESLGVSECAEACAGRPETTAVLRAMFMPEIGKGNRSPVLWNWRRNWPAGRAGRPGASGEFFAEAADLKEDMVVVAAGAFPYGDKAGMVHLQAFQIDRYLVTNHDSTHGSGAPRDSRRVFRRRRRPVIYANWHEARLYCRWRGGCRLSTEQEWEKAAAWDAANEKKRIYPWGDEFDSARWNTIEGETGEDQARWYLS